MGNLRFDEIKTVEEIEDDYILKHNDFLFARSGNTGGKSFIYDENIHPTFLYAGYFIKFEIDFSKINSLFFFYYTKSQIFNIWKNKVIRVMGQPNINAEEYKTLPILDIPFKKQESIVEKIKSELEKQKGIERQIEEKQKEISKIIEETIKS